jgi:hypothetical protein
MLTNTAARITILMTIFYVSCTNISGQNVGIGTATPAAILDVTSTNSGILIPRVSLQSNSDVTTVPSPAVSTMIYNTANAGTGTAAVSPGFYYWNGSQWVRVIDSNSLTAATMVSNSISGNNISTTVDGVTSTPVAVPNIYTSNGTLTGNRTVTMSGNTLGFTGGNVGVGNSTPNGQAILDLSNTSNYALVLPQIASGSIPSAPTKGMTLFNSTTNCLQYWNGSGWVNVLVGGNLAWTTDPAIACTGQNISYVFTSTNGASYQVTLTGAGNTVNGTNATVTPLTVTATGASTTLVVNTATSGILTVSLNGCPSNAQITQTISSGYGANVMDVNSQNVTSLTTTSANEIIFIDYETYKSNTINSPPTVNSSTSGVTNFWTSGQSCNSNPQHYDWYYLAPTAGTYTLGDAGNLSNNWAIGNVAVKNTYGCPLSASNIHYGPTTGLNNSGWQVSNCGNWVNITTNSVLPVGAFLCAATGDDGSSCGSGEANCSPQSGFAIYQAECDGDGNNETIGGVTITSAATQTLEISNTSQKNAGWQMILWWVQYP